MTAGLAADLREGVGDGAARRSRSGEAYRRLKPFVEATHG